MFEFSFEQTDTTPPDLTVPPNIAVPCTAIAADGRGCLLADGLAAWLASASASDLVDPAPVTHDAPAVFPMGFTTVTFRAADASRNVAQGTARVQVTYTFGNFPPPLMKDGSAAIRQGQQGRTIPVKFQLFCGGATVGTAVAALEVYKVLDAAIGTFDTTALTTDAGSVVEDGGLFRYEASSGTYIYHLSTRGFDAPGTYRIVVSLNDGTTHSVEFSLR